MSERDFPTLRAPGVDPKIHSIFDFTAEALGQLRLWLEMNPPAIGIQQILGFAQFLAKEDHVITATEQAGSATYGNLSTVGPTLTLGPGKYLFLIGAHMSVAGGGAAFMNVALDGSVLSDAWAAITESPSNVKVMSVAVGTLTADATVAQAKYKVSAVGPIGSFLYRSLIALKYANA